MPIVKDGAWIAIDSVDTDEVWFSGTGRPGDKLSLKDPWKNTIEVWKNIGTPPVGPESKDKMYGLKNGVWTVIDSTTTINVVDGKHSTVIDKGDGKLAIDVDINPELTDTGCLDFTN